MFRRKQEPCPVCAEKDKLIATLADQVDWLRLHSGTPLLQRQGSEQSAVPMVVDQARYMGEDEEELHELHSSGFIGDVELEKALAEIQALESIDIH